MKSKNSTKKHQSFTTKLGNQLHYYTKGSGVAVMLIHGFLGDASTWNSPRRGGSNIFNQLAENYSVIAVDNLGHGKSDKPHDSKHYGYRMVQDLIDLLDHLHIEKAHIIGYSMGSFSATAWAVLLQPILF